MVSVGITIRRWRSEATEVVNEKPNEGDIVQQFGFARPAGPAFGRSCAAASGGSVMYVCAAWNTKYCMKR